MGGRALLTDSRRSAHSNRPTKRPLALLNMKVKEEKTQKTAGTKLQPNSGELFILMLTDYSERGQGGGEREEETDEQKSLTANGRKKVELLMSIAI